MAQDALSPQVKAKLSALAARAKSEGLTDSIKAELSTMAAEVKGKVIPRPDYLQVKEPTDRPDMGDAYARTGREVGRTLFDSLYAIPQSLELLTQAGDKLFPGKGGPPPSFFTPETAQQTQSAIGLRPEERTGSFGERLVGGLTQAATFLVPAAGVAKLGPKAVVALGSAQSATQGFARGYYEAKGAGADEETAFKQALGTSILEGGIGAATSVLPAKAISHFAKANALSGGALANAALAGAINATSTMASKAGSEAIAVYLETLPPEERSSFLEILTNPDALPSALVGFATQGALEYSSRSTAKFHEALGLKEQLAQAEGQANTQIAGAEFAKGVEKRAQVPQLAERNPLELPQESPPAATTETPLRPLNQYVGLEGAMMRSGLTEAELALRVKGGELPVKMESRREPLFLLSDIERLGREIPSLEPAPPKAPPGVDPRYARQQAAETSQEPARPTLEAEKAPATEAPTGAAIEAPAKPSGRIKPETFLERTDRELGNVMAAWERITRYKLQPGLERKEPTYLGVEGQEDSDPTFRALRQAGIESQAHKVRSERFYDQQASGLKKLGLSREDFDEILYGRTGRERNAAMAKINEGRQGLSGISDQEADAIMAKWKADPRWPEIEKVLSNFDRMTRSNLQREVAEGLRTPEEAAKIGATYDFWAPLRTNVEGEPAGAGRRGVRGPESMRALGRTSKADSPFVFAQVADMRTTARIESNKTKRAAANFVRMVNNPDFAQVIPAEEFVKRGLVMQGGEETVGAVRDLSFLDHPEAVPFKEKGKQYAIVFGKDYKQLATALTGAETVTPGSIQNKLLGAAFKGANHYSRFFKRVASKDNPFFWPINLIAYDTPTTFARQWSERGLRFAFKEQVNAMRLIPDMLTNGPVMKRYRDAGAEMPSFGVEDFESTQKRIDAQIKAGEGGGALRHFFEAYERVGNLFENAHRVSVFDLATRSKERGGLGMSDDRGALAANEANINFSRQGQVGPLIEAMQPYYRSGANSVRAFTKIVRGKNFPQMAITAAAIGYLLDQYNRTVAGTDENGENNYDKREQWEKDSNFILMRPGGEPLKLPKPPGIAWLFNVGMYTSEATNGPIDADGAAGKVALNLVQNLSPMNVAPSPEGAATQIVPAPIRPAFEAAINTDRYGNDIVPENRGGAAQKEPHERYRKNVAPMVKATTDKLAEETDLSVSPSLVEHVLKGYLPGLLTELGRTVNVVNKKARGQEIAPTENPFTRRFVGDDSPYFTAKKFRENQELLNTSLKTWQAMPEGPEKRAYRRAHPEIGQKEFLEGLLQGIREATSEEVEQRLRAQFNRRIKATLAKRGESVSTPPPLVENK